MKTGGVGEGTKAALALAQRGGGMPPGVGQYPCKIDRRSPQQEKMLHVCRHRQRRIAHEGIVTREGGTDCKGGQQSDCGRGAQYTEADCGPHQECDRSVDAPVDEAGVTG